MRLFSLAHDSMPDLVPLKFGHRRTLQPDSSAPVDLFSPSLALNVDELMHRSKQTLKITSLD